MAAKVRARRPTTAIIMSHLCLRAGNSMAGPAATLSQLKDENLKVAGIAPGVPVEIHGSWNLNAKGVRVIAHLLANVGSPSSIMQAQPNEDMLASTTIVPLSILPFIYEFLSFSARSASGRRKTSYHRERKGSER